MVADGAPGLWKAARELWPSADEQRCTVHALRSVTAKLRERHHREVKAAGAGSSRGRLAVEARRELLALVGDYREGYSSTAAMIERDLDAFVAHLRWPSGHRKRVRGRSCSSAHSSRSAGAPR